MAGNVKEIDLSDFDGVAVKKGGTRVVFAADGGIDIQSDKKDLQVRFAANVNAPQTMTAIAASQKALEVGDYLQDGTVVIAVDLKNNQALFAPEGIFGGKATFDKQDAIPAQMNKQNAHGHNDWRRITDAEGETLSKAWDKVEPRELQGSAAPWFWLASSDNDVTGRVRRGGDADWDGKYQDYSRPVPVVRSGPARR